MDWFMFGIVIETGPKFYLVPFPTQKVTDLSKILCSTIPIPVHDLKIKVTDFEFFCVKSLQCQFLQSLWLIWIVFGMNGYKILKCFRKEKCVSGELPCPVTSLIFYQIRLDKVQWVHGQCPVSPWTQLTLSVDIVQSAWTLSRCPWTMSRLSTVSMDNVHWIQGHCPVRLVSLDFVHGLMDSLVFVQSVHGHCPGCPLSPWTMSSESMVKVQGVHWVHGLSTDGKHAQQQI